MLVIDDLVALGACTSVEARNGFGVRVIGQEGDRIFE
jgi:hypothetical protein